MVFHHLWLEARMQWHQYTRTVVVINDGIFVAGESRKWIRGRSWRQSGKVILVCFGLLVCLGASSFRFNLSKLTQHPNSTALPLRSTFFSFVLSFFSLLSSVFPVIFLPLILLHSSFFYLTYLSFKSSPPLHEFNLLTLSSLASTFINTL